jgi:hypothetical protein
MTKSPKSIVALGFSLGLVASACAARKAEDACNDYLDAVADCVGVAGIPNVGCDGAKGSDLDYFECLAAWAEDGCNSTDLLDCVQ